MRAIPARPWVGAVVVFVTWASLAVAAGHVKAAEASNAREMRGREAFAAGRYQDALDIFVKLYAETLHPNYLRNIGRCYQNLGDADKAISSFREYLRKAKGLSAKEREEIHGYINEMEELKQRKAAAGTPPPPPVAPAPAPAAAPPPSLVASPPPAPARRVSLRSWVGVAVTGAAAVATVFAGLATNGRFTDLRGSCGVTPQGCTPSEMDSVSSRALITNVLLGVTAAAAVATGVSFYLDLRQTETKASLAWAVTF